MVNNNGKLFLVSCLMLFMEIFLIRWIATEVRIFAYVSNLVLLACFLGIGVGCYLAKKEANLLITLGMLVLISISVKSLPFRHITDMLSSFSDSVVWFEFSQGSLLFALQGVALTLYLFLMIVVAFIPLGQVLGKLLDEHSRIIAAYSINIAGSLLGIWLFNLCSFLYLAPWLWFLFAFFILVWLIPRSRMYLLLSALAGALILLVTGISNPKSLTIWTPYQKLEVFPNTYKGIDNGYFINVNTVGYMSITNLSKSFLAEHPRLYDEPLLKYNQYEMPYAFKDAIETVLIVGAGAGNDVAGALRNSAQQIDAVEIDPGIYRLGLQYHPEKPYQNPRVRVFVDDARAFFKKADRRYDVIAFGLLDSHTLSSNYNNTRLDHYVYTEESFREAKRLLKADGILTVSFAVQRDWIGVRIVGLLKKVFGGVPYVVTASIPSDSYGWGGAMFVTGNNLEKLKQFVAAHHDLSRYLNANLVHVQVPDSFKITTDDWPYLYIEKPSIPRMYLLIIIALVLLFIMAQRFLISTGSGTLNLHFFFLGAAFMLLEFQNVSKATLLFGSTWIVNANIISAILALILLSNICAYCYPLKNMLPVYCMLLASVLALYFIPLDVFNNLGNPAKPILASLILNLPIFFAGLIFIYSFSSTPAKDTAFGSNLLGAAVGGLLEPLSFVTGIKALLLIVCLLYLMSYVCLPASRRTVAQSR